MYNYLKGKIVSKAEDSPIGCNLTLEVNNIGYLIFTNKRVIASLPETDDAVTIYTSLIHREDSMSLCGFSFREERDLFNILNSVSGVGTKVALAIMDELGAYDLIDAVISQDQKSISRAKGVGPKLAGKIIIELKDKMTKWRDKIPVKPSEKTEINTPEMEEAESVLLSLGYTKKETTEALKMATNSNDSETIIRVALQWLAAQEK